MNYREINDLFFNMEVKNDFFSLNIDGIYFWKLIRVHVYNDVIGAVLSNGKLHPNASTYSISEIIKSKLIIYYAKIFHKTKPLKKDTKVLVFKHRRRINVNGDFVEVNTDYLDLTGYVDKNTTWCVDTDIAFGNRNIDKNGRNFLLPSPHMILFYRLWNKIFIHEKKELVSNINNLINSTFGISIDIHGYLERELAGYKAHYYMVSKYLRNANIKEIIVVCSYGKEGIIQAARDMGIMTSEIQHGVINRYHLGYSFPIELSKNKVKYFPDNILLYGDFWINVANYPVKSKENLITVGSPYFDLQYRKYSVIRKEPNSVLFVSAGPTGKKMSEVAHIIARELPDTHIYYKLHPSEFSVWKEIYPDLKKGMIDNLEVVEDGINIFELYAKCNALVGVKSTTIYESFAFISNVILYNLPGVEEMQTVIDHYSIPVARDTKELIALLQDYPLEVHIDSDQFYKIINR